MHNTTGFTMNHEILLIKTNGVYWLIWFSIDRCYLIDLFIKLVDQKHFLCTIVDPTSSYSSLVIHMASNVESDNKMDPPIQAENFLSGVATTLIFIEEGANEVTSLESLSGIPGNMVVPPDIKMLS